VSVILLLAFLFCPLTQGQIKEQAVFDSVPVSLRARLTERLTLLIKYQRTQQWANLHGLLAEIYIGGESKEQFTKRFANLQAQGLLDELIDFTPKSTVVHSESVDHGEWTIFGCAKLSEKKQTRYLYASVTAWREKGDWFFSDIGIITPIDGPAQRCLY
jgi:hypothetical protein